MSNTTTRSLGPADEALIAAEREILELWRQVNAFFDAGDSSDHLELSGRAFALDAYIAKLAPDSLVGAAIKLRRLADPNVGIAGGIAPTIPGLSSRSSPWSSAR